jgi:hypothetical protein
MLSMRECPHIALTWTLAVCCFVTAVTAVTEERMLFLGLVWLDNQS